MKGIELARRFYEEYGKQMISEQFADFKERIAVGLVGHGSECFGFDDEISQDHDFEPGFCIWITEDDEKKFGFNLFRAYSKLPCEFKGFVLKEKSLYGSNKKGVITIPEFYRQYTGRCGAPETLEDWLYTPAHYLAEATNGEIFSDPLGEFTRIRNQIKNGMPEDVRLKKIASCAFYLAQYGQYNYSRCIAHGEHGAAALALSEFVKKGIEIVFLLNRAHMPYYKWAFRAMKELDILSETAIILENMINASNSDFGQIKNDIEQFCAIIASELRRQGISASDSDYLESHAYNINERISDHRLRNMPIML